MKVGITVETTFEDGNIQRRDISPLFLSLVVKSRVRGLLPD
jgi:hypothetical protein